MKSQQAHNKRPALLKRLWKFHPEAFLFLSTFIGFITLSECVIKLCEACKVELPFLAALGGLGLYLIGLHGILLAFVIVSVRRIFTQDASDAVTAPIGGTSILTNDLIQSLNRALGAGKFTEVMRIGSALSQPLFESGGFEARLGIGVLVEEAAAAMSNPMAQMIALIDLIGWSCIELGDYARGEQEVLHGEEIAKVLQDFSYMSKARRHLGVICRRQSRFPQAEAHYVEARALANQITVEDKRLRSNADIDYAMACLYEHTDKYTEALSAIDAAIDGFTKANDRYKVTMAQTTKGTICLKVGKASVAKDLLRKAAHDVPMRAAKDCKHVGAISD